MTSKSNRSCLLEYQKDDLLSGV